MIFPKATARFSLLVSPSFLQFRRAGWKGDQNKLNKRWNQNQRQRNALCWTAMFERQPSAQHQGALRSISPGWREQHLLATSCKEFHACNLKQGLWNTGISTAYSHCSENIYESPITLFWHQFWIRNKTETLFKKYEVWNLSLPSHPPVLQHFIS